jgi:hypothetical protein
VVKEIKRLSNNLLFFGGCEEVKGRAVTYPQRNKHQGVSRGEQRCAAMFLTEQGYVRVA